MAEQYAVPKKFPLTGYCTQDSLDKSNWLATRNNPGEWLGKDKPGFPQSISDGQGIQAKANNGDWLKIRWEG